MPITRGEHRRPPRSGSVGGAPYAARVTTPTPAAPSIGLVRRARRIDRVLAERYPDARCELDFGTPFQLLVATVLSAQTTDVRVNQTTPELFGRFPDAAALAAVELPELEEICRPLGFFRAKSRAIQGLAAALVERYGGEVPRRMADLVTLPGVGRKTANVVLGNAFGVPGLPVDTHVMRLARRLGYTSSEDPVQVEADVTALLPRQDWTMASHRLIFHGRRTCFARKPACGACPVFGLCPSAGIGENDPVRAAAMLKG